MARGGDDVSEVLSLPHKLCLWMCAHLLTGQCAVEWLLWYSHPISMLCARHTFRSSELVPAEAELPVLVGCAGGTNQHPPCTSEQCLVTLGTKFRIYFDYVLQAIAR